jgi:hypothetical protein
MRTMAEFHKQGQLGTVQTVLKVTETKAPKKN